MSLIDVRADHLKIVQDILQTFVPEREVWAFGSRAKWLAKEYSDLDLCIVGETPLSFRTKGLLEEAFQDSDLPYKVDVVDWAGTSASFREIVARDKVVVQEGGKNVGVAEEWQIFRLEELCDFVNGFAFKSTDYVPASSDTIEVFRMGYIARGGGFKEDDTPVFVPKQYGRNLEKYILCSGDITIAMTDMKDRVAILGNTALVRDEARFVLNQRVGCIRVKQADLLDARFLYFYSNWTPHVEYLRSRANSGVQVNLSTSAIKDSMLEIPPLSEQRAIAHILGTLDDKIELNRKQNATLEEMARAMFKAWFVDFEPVRAKMDGRWQRGQSLPGLPAHLYDLFPDRFVESEFGEIPEGWEMCSLDSIANYLNGLALQKFPPESETEFLPVIKIAQLRAGNTNGADRASARIKPEYIVVDGDVLFSWSGSLEVEVWNGGPGALNQHLFKVTSDTVPKWFYFFATRQHLSDFRGIAAGKATTMGHIQRKHLTDARIAVAPPESMKKFDTVIASQFDQLVSNAQQSRSLAQLRDTLLPRLISGELRVKDAAAFPNPIIS